MSRRTREKNAENSTSRRGGAASSGRLEKAAFWALALCLAAQLVFLGEENRLRLQTAEKVSAVRLNDQPPQGAPLPAGTREQHLILPGGAMDARWWALHAETLLREGRFRIRETDLDNAPEGREVHWSSLLTWILAAAAVARSVFAEGAVQEHVAWAALHISPWIGLAALAAFVWLIWRRAGAAAGLVFGNAALASPAVARAFEAGEADHHGFVIAFAAGSLAALWVAFEALSGPGGRAVKGAGKVPAEAGVGLARLGGFLAGAALWVSAATTIPVLAGCGTGLALVILSRKSGAGAVGQGLERLIRVWSGWGAAASLGFYLLEYFPGHMGWRLEVNHPLYALAFLGAGRLLAYAAVVSRSKHPEGELRRRLPALLAAALAAAAPALVILVFQKEVFWVADPLLHALHKEYIHEFQSLFRLVSAEGWDWGYPLAHLWAAAALTCGGWLVALRNTGPSARAALIVALAAALVMQALAFYQIRWGSAAQALWAVAAVISFQAASSSGRALAAAVIAALLALASVPLIRIPSLLVAHVQEARCVAPPIPQESGNSIILRDIAHRLIHSTPQKSPVVLTGPNSSTELAYHGRIQTLGTLYWENMPGIKRAAALFAEPDEARVLAGLREAGVTHILVPSWDNFSEAYMNLLAVETGKGPQGEPFLNKVCKGEVLPDWLRPFAYPIPSASGLDTKSVRIFAVLPEQNAFEVWFFRGVYHFESAEWKEAREAFEKAGALRPGEPRVRAYLEQLEKTPPAAPGVEERGQP